MQPTEPQDEASPAHFDGFISYAREDLDFVKDLIPRLAARDRRLWIDLEGLYSGEEWWPRICAAIESADAFIFVISPASAASLNCAREAEHAASQKKKILPVLLTDVGDARLPEPVATHQWIFHDHQIPQVTANRIADGLERDPVWHRQHSRLLQRAMEWARTDRASSLLFGEDLGAAQEWLESTNAKAGREASPIQVRFIEASLDGQSAHAARLSRRLAARILRETDLDPELGVLLSLAAIDDFARTPLAVRALHESIEAFRGRLRLDFPYAVEGLAFAPDGSELAICTAGGTLTILDAVTGEVLSHMESDADPGRNLLGDVAYSPEGDLMALAATVEKSLLLIDRRRQTSIAEFDLGEPVSRVAFSHDGRLVAAHSRSGLTKLWEVESQALWATCRGGGSAGPIAFLPDSRRLVTPSRECEAWIWDVSTRGEKTTPLLEMVGHEGAIMDLSVSRDGRIIATGGLDGSIRTWSAETAEERGVIDRGGWIYAARMSPGGERIGVHAEIQIGLTPEGVRRPVGHLEIWEGETQALSKQLLRRPHLGRVVGFSPDWTRVATAGIESETWMWDARAERHQVSMEGPDTILDHCFCGDDAIAVRIIGGELRLFEARTGALRHAREMGWYAGTSIAASADGTRIATQTNEGVLLLDADSGRKLDMLPIARSERIAFTPEGDHLVTLSSEQVVVWPMQDPERYRVFPAEPNFQLSFDVSRDGRRIVTATPAAVQLWDLESGEEIQRVLLGGHERGVTRAAVAPDGTHFAILKEGTTGIWADAGEQECALQWGKYNHASEWVCDPVMAVFAPAGDRLATASTDGAVLIWDVESGELVQMIALGNATVPHAAFSADGTRIAARLERASTITIWDCLPERQLIELARSRSFRALTKEERVEYELSQPDATERDDP